MFKFLKRLFDKDKEEISDKAVEHSSLGNYQQNNRMTGGGHGQEALDYMDKNGIKYNVVKTYKNGVRVGNVPNHKKTKKQVGTNQSWFPKNWGRKKIKKAGQFVARGEKYDDGHTKSKRYKGVDVGIKRTDKKIATIFPLNKQTEKNKKGENNYE